MRKYLKIIIITLILLIPITTNAQSKTETVYSILDKTGKVKTTKINTKLSNLESKEITDYTKLDNIKNINGDEKFNKDSDKLIWKSTGKNIFYQGKINSELPISVSVKYYLNNKEVKEEELKNKKGNIKIEYTFINNSYDYSSSMYTPFVVTLISSLTEKNNKNITVENAKIISTGNRNIITGIALPGLNKTLDIDELKGMDRITINYDTEKYKSNETYFVITPKLLDKLDLNIFDKLATLNEDTKKLQDGVDKLASGSEKLSNGINAYTDGVNKVNDGSKTVLQGMESAISGAKQLEQGNKEVDNNLKQIIAGLKQGEEELNAKSEELNTKIIEINTLKENNENAITKLTNTNNLIVQGVLNQTGNQINISELSEEELTSTLNYLISQGQMTENEKESIINYKKSYDGNISLITLLSANKETIEILINTLVNTTTSINEKLSEIDNYLTQLETYGTNKTSSGSYELRSGLEKLYSGSSKLFSGIDTLNNQSSLLNSGSSELTKGIDTLNKEGITKLTNIAKKLSEKTDTIKTLTKLSKNYKGFGSINADNTIFIYKIK